MHKVVADEKVCHGFFVVSLSMILDTIVIEEFDRRKPV